MIQGLSKLWNSKLSIQFLKNINNIIIMIIVSNIKSSPIDLSINNKYKYILTIKMKLNSYNRELFPN